jgi:hypothetical protein
MVGIPRLGHSYEGGIGFFKAAIPTEKAFSAGVFQV